MVLNVYRERLGLPDLSIKSLPAALGSGVLVLVPAPAPAPASAIGPGPALGARSGDLEWQPCAFSELFLFWSS